ncbi:inorganic triphosphatase [Photorhabdus heterorhabditis]|uniref:CYTH domain-containing protein n=1 Tax=Photorhabdus heterorhabditis TaxID=880156 RepID=UPI0015629352|nr:CYTH domain-containing protein [Photorhabdus heterorhabditis]NRN28003.1 inorganic triphosphatase [Photorhabdus heterorhabditis subsp. aluminescens]
MSVEIELKLTAKQLAIPVIRQQLSLFPHHYFAPQKLTNIYFETPDNQLRRLDMGLRIRGFDDQYEMTIKTAGKVIGGLHQRPEYDVPLVKPELALTLFPPHIWPENCDVKELQSRLHALFSTDFMREKWVITYGQSEIEVVFDQGEIIAAGRKVPICEFELELKRGTIADVFALAFELAKSDGLRQGNKSKAARGYQLAQGKPRVISSPVPTEIDMQQPLSSVLSSILSHWQDQEECWSSGLSEGRDGLKQVLTLVQQTIKFLSKPAGRLEQLDDQLTVIKQKLSEVETEAETLCYSSVYLQCKLALTMWLVNLSA